MSLYHFYLDNPEQCSKDQIFERVWSVFQMVFLLVLGLHVGIPVEGDNFLTYQQVQDSVFVVLGNIEDDPNSSGEVL